MSDNQSWNSSGSEEVLETESGQHVVGSAQFGGILSKVRIKRFISEIRRYMGTTAYN